MGKSIDMLHLQLYEELSWVFALTDIRVVCLVVIERKTINNYGDTGSLKGRVTTTASIDPISCGSSGARGALWTGFAS